MNTRKFLNTIKGIAGEAARIPLIKKMLKPIYYPFKRSLIKRYKNEFTKSALIALEAFDKCLTENNIKYSLAFGSLLGAVREKGFIKHDIDIDVFIWNEDYSSNINKVLTSNGFELVHTYTVEDGTLGREDTYRFKGAYIDIFYLYGLDDNFYYCCDFLPIEGTGTSEMSMKRYGKVLPRQITLPISKDIIRTKFETLELPIPHNAHDILKYRYGDDYMIPNPSWGIRSYDSHITEWRDKIAIYRSY